MIDTVLTFAEAKVSAALHGASLLSKLIHCLYPVVDPGHTKQQQQQLHLSVHRTEHVSTLLLQKHTHSSSSNTSSTTHVA